jgi:hypothetical protein
MILSTLLSVTGEPADAEPAIRAVINATDAGRIISINPVPLIRAGFAHVSFLIRRSQFRILFVHAGRELVEVL